MFCIDVLFMALSYVGGKWKFKLQLTKREACTSGNETTVSNLSAIYLMTNIFAEYTPLEICV